MSEILSQDQIDQLLSAGGIAGDSGAAGGGATGTQVTDTYPSLDKNFELYCKHASKVLGTVLNKKVTVSCEASGKADFGTMKTALTEESLCIVMPFKAGFTGELNLFLKKKDIAVLADLMIMGDGKAGYTPEHNDAVIELTNQINGSFATALSSHIGTEVSFVPSKIMEWSFEAPPVPQDRLDMVFIRFTIEGWDESTAVMLVGQELSILIAEKNPAAGGGPEPQTSFGADTGFGEVAPGFPGMTQDRNIEMLLDVELDVNIELGRTSLSIKRILELAPGSIVELDRMAGEPVDLMVNNKVVAKGEVVVVDESFGIRILSLVSPEERIKSLR